MAWKHLYSKSPSTMNPYGGAAWAAVEFYRILTTIINGDITYEELSYNAGSPIAYASVPEPYKSQLPSTSYSLFLGVALIIGSVKYYILIGGYSNYGCIRIGAKTDVDLDVTQALPYWFPACSMGSSSAAQGNILLGYDLSSDSFFIKYSCQVGLDFARLVVDGIGGEPNRIYYGQYTNSPSAYTKVDSVLGLVTLTTIVPSITNPNYMTGSILKGRVHLLALSTSLIGTFRDLLYLPPDTSNYAVTVLGESYIDCGSSNSPFQQGGIKIPSTRIWV